MKRLILTAFLLLTYSGHAADAPTDRTCIAEQRQLLALQAANAQLQFENAQLKLKQLADEEAALKKAEKPSK